LVVAVAATARLFVWPETTHTSNVDAVVVFGAAVDERLAKGLQLVDGGLAPVLVLSAPDGTEFCTHRPNVRVICFEPDPFTTRGEARAVGRLARARAWKRVALVTSTYHATRARLLLDRCYAGEIDVVAAEPREGFRTRIAKILHEWGGLAYAVAAARGC
jgi:uncharacterized SAM-binding protein YcdF (DUF218 family)